MQSPHGGPLPECRTHPLRNLVPAASLTRRPGCPRNDEQVQQPQGASCHPWTIESTAVLSLLYHFVPMVKLHGGKKNTSGKLTVCYGKWPFVVHIPIHSMVIFHSYVSLREGIPSYPRLWQKITQFNYPSKVYPSICP